MTPRCDRTGITVGPGGSPTKGGFPSRWTWRSPRGGTPPRVHTASMSATAAGSGSAMIGREAELELVESFVRSPSTGRALVIEGEPGIGKTTLWRAGVEAAAARGALVLRSQPTAAEAHLSFSALGDLLAGRLDEVLDRLPDPQRHALRVALVLEDAGESAPDPMALASAVLGALRMLARGTPGARRHR